MTKNQSARVAWAIVPALLVTAAAVAAGRTDCWMTGGGSVFRDNGGEVVVTGPKIGRVTHGFELHCDRANPNNLEINWKDDGGNAQRFHLEQLTSAVCTDSPLIEPDPPGASFDTFTGEGNGRYSGAPGATAQWVFTDAGEGGSGDTASIQIWDAGGNLVLTVSGYLTFGNHQAHSK
jgi:hypothetical protein